MNTDGTARFQPRKLDMIHCVEFQAAPDKHCVAVPAKADVIPREVRSIIICFLVEERPWDR